MISIPTNKKVSMKNNLTIRAAKESDLAKVCEIFKEVLLNSTATFEETPYDLNAWKEIFQNKQSAGFPFLVATMQDQVIGYATYGNFRKASGYRISVEHSLHVDKNFRGQGIGSILLESIITEARKQKFSSMIAAVDSENTTSIMLHQKFGFFIAGKLPNVAEKFSRRLSLTLLQKEL